MVLVDCLSFFCVDRVSHTRSLVDISPVNRATDVVDWWVVAEGVIFHHTVGLIFHLDELSLPFPLTHSSLLP